MNKEVTKLNNLTGKALYKDCLAIAIVPVPISISLETLKKEQGYSMDKLNESYAQLDRSIWEGEDIEQLLQML